MKKGFAKRTVNISRGKYLLSVIFFIIALFASYKLIVYLRAELVKDISLPVRAVKIDGVLVQISKKQIADVAGLMAGNKNIATLNLEKVHNAILQIPWINKVSVVKKMPDTLIISVVEHVPAAFWNDNGLYDAKSRSVFYPDLSTFKQNLVRLSAPHDELASDVYDYAVSFLPILDQGGLKMVALNLDNIRTLRLTLDNGVVLVLGRDDENNIVHKRLTRFVKANNAEHFDFSQINYIDLRYDVGFAIGYKNSKK